MWICPYCGGDEGQPFHDDQLSGVLCLAPDCGRFDARVDDAREAATWEHLDM